MFMFGDKDVILCTYVIEEGGPFYTMLFKGPLTVVKTNDIKTKMLELGVICYALSELSSFHSNDTRESWDKLSPPTPNLTTQELIDLTNKELDNR